MKTTLSLLSVALPLITVSQSFELGTQSNFSKHIWDANYSLANSKSYEPGYGFFISYNPKLNLNTDNRISVGASVDFSQYKAFVYRANTSESSYGSWAQIQKIGVSAPIKFKLLKENSSKLAPFIVASPRYAFTIDQSYYAWEDSPNLVNFGDLSLALKFGTDIRFGGKKSPDKSNTNKLQFSGLSVSAGRLYDINKSVLGDLGNAALHQYFIEVGLKFSSKRDKIIDYGKRAEW